MKDKDIWYRWNNTHVYFLFTKRYEIYSGKYGLGIEYYTFLPAIKLNIYYGKSALFIEFGKQYRANP